MTFLLLRLNMDLILFPAERVLSKVAEQTLQFEPPAANLLASWPVASLPLAMTSRGVHEE